ncbi:hypothetical protein AAHC03_09729 [Spirometra sp. Aus1]
MPSLQPEFFIHLGPLGEKGEPGEEGVKAEDGEDGDVGERGEQGADGSEGTPGLDGPRGPPGEKGQSGESGEPGSFGEDGLNGSPGEEGDYGDQGPRGPTGPDGPDGEQGPQGPKGQKGEAGHALDGEQGEIGEPGPSGEPGEEGEEGEKGPQGMQGDKGEKGQPGRLEGPRGPEGEQGEIGEEGDVGPKGEAGPKGDIGPDGPPGELGAMNYSSILFARHFQAPEGPYTCPTGTQFLYDGYSYLMGGGTDHLFNMDLGTPSSCLRRFSTLPMTQCERDEICHWNARQERSYWLATLKPRSEEPIPIEELDGRIARCVVCEAPTNVFAFHSQTNTLTPCPNTWTELWAGVSLVLHTSGGFGGGQGLSSPGSCMEQFHYSPVLECNNNAGTCHYWNDAKVYYLRAIPPGNDTQFVKPVGQMLKAAEGPVVDSLSKCRVCMKTPV